MKVLVLGGAGYIGSHTVYALIEAGEQVVIIDNLLTGYEEAVHPDATFYKGDIRDREFLDSVFEKEKDIDKVYERIPGLKGLAEKEANFYVINATEIAKEVGMGRRTNTILQSAFFALNTQIMPLEESLKHMKHMAEKSYSKKGQEIVELNYKAIDAGKDGFVKVDVKPEWKDLTVNANAKTGDEYFDEHLTEINNLNGYDLPTSHFTKYGILDGSIHNEVSFKEKRKKVMISYQFRFDKKSFFFTK